MAKFEIGDVVELLKSQFEGEFAVIKSTHKNSICGVKILGLTSEIPMHDTWLRIVDDETAIQWKLSNA